MRAAQILAPERIEIRDVDPPRHGDLAVVTPEVVGICGTDLKIFGGTVPAAYPVTVGHEMVGRVVHPGAGLELATGQRVLVDPAIACGHCDRCLHRQPHLCTNGGLMGRDADGVFADEVPVPPSRLVDVPESVSDRSAALLQVLGTVVHAQRMATVFPGDIAVVVGLGVAGQLMCRLLTVRGATVVGVTRSEHKRALAATHGAIVASPGEAEDAVLEASRGAGASLVVEAAGTESTLGHAIELSGVGGELLVFGTTTGGSSGLPYYQLYLKELTVHNPRAALLEDYARAVRLVADGRLDVEDVLSDLMAFDAVEGAFAAAADPATLKIAIRMGETPPDAS